MLTPCCLGSKARASLDRATDAQTGGLGAVAAGCPSSAPSSLGRVADTVFGWRVSFFLDHVSRRPSNGHATWRAAASSGSEVASPLLPYLRVHSGYPAGIRGGPAAVVRLGTMRNLIAILLLGASLSAAAETSARHPRREDGRPADHARGAPRSHPFLASDLLEGRGPATRGDRLAEAYIQSQMEALGLKPGAPRRRLGPESPARRDPRVLPRGTGGVPVAGRDGPGIPGESLVASSGVQRTAARIENAEVVFVGYGIVAPEFQWDDYKDVDLRGKVLLVMNNDPESDPSLFAGKTRLWYGRWDYKYLMAARKGAVGAIIIHTTHSAGYGWPVVQNSWSGELFELPDDGTRE